MSPADAPETDRARCEAERVLGQRASHRLRQLVNAGGLDLHEIRCSCPEGTHGTQACNYGRRCATLKAHGRDVGTAAQLDARHERAGANDDRRTAQGNRAGNPRPARRACPQGRAAKLDTLAYVLDMAIMQANDAIGPEH